MAKLTTFEDFEDKERSQKRALLKQALVMVMSRKKFGQRHKVARDAKAKASLMEALSA